MDKKVSILATTFISSLLMTNLSSFATAKEMVKDSNIRVLTEKTYDIADEFLIQLLVQGRYTTASSVVWVYGCADKT